MGLQRNYTHEQMLEAIAAVKKGTLAAAVAKEFNVPQATLVYKARGKSSTVCRIGPSPVLTDAEEKIIKQWLLHAARLQYPIMKELLCDSVQHIIKNKERPNPFNDEQPRRKWHEAFFKRHPELCERTVRPLSSARSGVTEEQIRNWFAVIKLYLKEKNLLVITNEPTKITTKKGDKNVYLANNIDEKENITLLVTTNAAMIDFLMKAFLAILHIVFHLHGELASLKVAGCVMDMSHLTLHVSEFCSENGIELISLYPNSMHLLQPVDVAVIYPIKAAWRKEVRKWKVEQFGN
ncbi:hypothetical protein PR048_011197 [Dryococelus australis]|uniref:HTH psq-type domain-containing protein n=1 Tax=Dryococelus australis TaxID=614101 RepID=A0ABQ9HKV5_9NEOP|nr:hypothetical protein PR048_011197 [Dryococelus australis]